MTIDPAELLKILLAILAGGVIGADREHHDKPAGLGR